MGTLFTFLLKHIFTFFDGRFAGVQGFKMPRYIWWIE
jgi:hypothetical protein